MSCPLQPHVPLVIKFRNPRAIVPSCPAYGLDFPCAFPGRWVSVPSKLHEDQEWNVLLTPPP